MKSEKNSSDRWEILSLMPFPSPSRAGSVPQSRWFAEPWTVAHSARFAALGERSHPPHRAREVREVLESEAAIELRRLSATVGQERDLPHAVPARHLHDLPHHRRAVPSPSCLRHRDDVIEVSDPLVLDQRAERERLLLRLRAGG